MRVGPVENQGSNAIINRSRVGNITHVRVSGVIDETFPLVSSSADLNGIVILDLGCVDRISSFGVRKWIEFVSKLPSGAIGMYMVYAPPVVVDQLNMVEGFAGVSRVLSVLAPYTCKQCNEDRLRAVNLVDEAQTISESRAPEHTCPVCSSPLEFADLPGEFFDYARRQHLGTVDPVVMRYLRLSVAAEPLDLPSVLKIVQDDITYVTLASVIRGDLNVRKLASGNVSNRARLATDVLVMLAVASIAIAAGVALAVVAGVGIAVLSFLVNMSHSVVRRVTRGEAMRSRRSRGAEEMAVLARAGARIAVIELEGVIFFGTADDLLVCIDRCLQDGATHIIVDLGRVNDVDTTGAQMLIQIHERVRARGGLLLVSQAGPGQPQRDFLDDMGVVARLGEQAFTHDIDHALEIAEDVLLDAEGARPPERAEIPLAELHPFAQLTPAELAVLEPLLDRRVFAPGEVIFREGDPGDELFVIARGSASVRRADGARSTRLLTFSAGMVFGEMALLDARPRSANVQADGELVCHVLPRAAFDQVVAHHQGVAVKLLTSFAQELGRRLRFTNEIVDHLQA